MRHECDFVYPPAVTKRILGTGLSLFTAAAALQKALGTTPFSVTDAPAYSASYYIALAYTTLGILLGVASAVYALKNSSLRFMGYLAAYLLSFAAVSVCNNPQTVWMQIANMLTFIGISMAAFSGWMRFKREGR
ncbi:hypothetical protein [Actinacidiphila glaucinigra]|uniref:hypothetical protein n=1 Tax=Actinacidiphila glaucinigra TaxID=235986 RepID=UPI00367269E5